MGVQFFRVGADVVCVAQADGLGNAAYIHIGQHRDASNPAAVGCESAAHQQIQEGKFGLVEVHDQLSILIVEVSGLNAGSERSMVR